MAFKDLVADCSSTRNLLHSDGSVLESGNLKTISVAFLTMNGALGTL